MTNQTTIRSKRSRISNFKQPFIAGMLSSSSLFAGCAHHPEPPADGSVCPAELPTEGDSCFGYDRSLSCGEPCTAQGVFRCDEDGTWTEVMWGCNPPPPPITDCPLELPEIGEQCNEYEPELTCFTTDDCGANYGVVCGESGYWEDARMYIACNPPMPVIEAGTSPSTLDAGVAQE